LEGRKKDEILEEWKLKVLPTYILGAVVWIPAQIINFKLISPQYRVAYVACLVLLEVNILCVVKRFSPDNINKKIEQYCGNSVNGNLHSSKPNGGVKNGEGK
jgi:hypothetical protein